MTVRELRQMLTHVNDQSMTIKELRAILFREEEQDKELTDADMIAMTWPKKEEE